MSQIALLDVCESCGEESEPTWMLCHLCAGVVFRAWYFGGMVLPADAEAIFAGLLGKLAWGAA